MKSWYQSTGVWGGIIAVAAPIIASIFHVTISSEDTLQIVNILTAAADLVGGALAIYGRVRATRQIG